MSPEHKEYLQIPKDLREKVRDLASESGSNLQELIDTGFGFLVNNSVVTKIVEIDKLSENALKDARKQHSPWHLVHGLANRSHHIVTEKWRKLSSAEARLKRGHSRGGVRGKRRSLKVF